MEHLIIFVDILVVILLLILPILAIRNIYRRNLKFPFAAYLLAGFSGLTITIFLAWWIDYSNYLLLRSYGFDFNAMSEHDAFKNVIHEKLYDAKLLYSRLMGIGWPVKAVFMLLFYVPYHLIIYFFYHLLKNRK